jgi:hypothetical protein
MSDRFPNLGAMPSRQGHAPSPSTGAASAQAGMVRIQRGSETRYVWPVHLPGWLAMGWQVGSGEPVSAAAAAPTPVVVTPNALSAQPPAATPARSNPGPSGQRSAAPVGTGSTGRAAPEPSAPQPVSATNNSTGGAATTPSAAQTISPPAAADSPRQPEADLTAHLPTNLLGLDEEPAERQATPAENDAVSAWNPGAETDRPSAADSAVAALSDELAAPARPVADPEPAPDADGAPAGVNPPADESAAEPAARRRGRPRKARPEPEQQPAAEVMAQKQPPAVQDSEGPLAPDVAITTEGDDPFGLDPLL